MAAAGLMEGRAGAMAARLVDTAERLGIDAPGRAIISAAFVAAMRPRLSGGLDDHGPEYLHPARTALILMEDAGVGEPATLAAAILTETRHPGLRPDADEVDRLGEQVRGLVAAVPDPEEDERVLESLIVAGPDVRLIAVAERLDHARHLHLRPRSEWPGYHAVTCASYAPAAARSHPVLGRRLAWWCRSFRDRFLRPG
ncbi:MAG: HD domain-containing protein [Gemmatimonadetes bacterium]|nr:HD domain-containing protein [Gemmatimonadota bacterium]